MAGIFLVSILQAGDWARVSSQATHYLSTYITATDSPKIQCRVLSWALVSSQPVGKCQTLTYMMSCGYDVLSGYSSPQY